MRWALKKGERILAKPKEKANCPICNNEVISKCGVVKQWHWAHKNIFDCDSWAEPESEWHLKWKDKFPKEFQEVVIKNHRADIKTKDGIVIELQNSPISADEIIRRENFYVNMIWLLHGKNLTKGLDLRKKGDIITFRWKHPPKSWWEAKKQIFVDLNNFKKTNYDIWDYDDYFPYSNNIFHIKKIYPNMPCGGYGKLMTKEEFINKFRG